MPCRLMLRPRSLRRRSTVRIDVTRIGDSPIEGPSGTSIRGCDMRARPIASICCCPPRVSGLPCPQLAQHREIS